MRIFITGGSGTIGRRLVLDRLSRRHSIVALTRSRSRFMEAMLPEVAQYPDSLEVIEANPMVPGAWQKRVDGCDAVINLAGAGVLDRRWTDSYKQLLRESRIDTTYQVVRAIEMARSRPDILLNASAIGFYGDRADRELDESDQIGEGFLADLCNQWESQAWRAEPQTRVVCMRFGMILDREGGAAQDAQDLQARSGWSAGQRSTVCLLDRLAGSAGDGRCVSSQRPDTRAGQRRLAPSSDESNVHEGARFQPQPPGDPASPRSGAEAGIGRGIGGRAGIPERQARRDGEGVVQVDGSNDRTSVEAGDGGRCQCASLVRGAPHRSRHRYDLAGRTAAASTAQTRCRSRCEDRAHDIDGTRRCQEFLLQSRIECQVVAADGAVILKREPSSLVVLSELTPKIQSDLMSSITVSNQPVQVIFEDKFGKEHVASGSRKMDPIPHCIRCKITGDPKMLEPVLALIGDTLWQPGHILVNRDRPGRLDIVGPRAERCIAVQTLARKWGFQGSRSTRSSAIRVRSALPAGAERPSPCPAPPPKSGRNVMCRPRNPASTAYPRPWTCSCSGGWVHPPQSDLVARMMGV